MAWARSRSCIKGWCDCFSVDGRRPRREGTWHYISLEVGACVLRMSSTHHILCYPDVCPVLIELPDVQEQYISCFCKSLCLLCRPNGEPQHNVLAIACHELLCCCLMRAAEALFRVSLGTWEAPYLPNDGVGESTPRGRRLVWCRGVRVIWVGRMVVRGGRCEWSSS
jgi:hypothetical protein